MKKILLTILALTILTAQTAALTAYAGTITHSQSQYSNKVLIAEFKPSIVPKPYFLPGPSEKDQEEKGARSILVDKILPKFVVGLVGTVGGIALLFIIIGGVRFATAYGNDEAVKKAKDQVIFGIVGFLIALLAYTIVTIIINLNIPQDTTENPAKDQETTQK